MARFLRQGTVATIKVGPFLDDTDGKTAETALTPTVKLSKNGGALAARNSATAIVHDADGYYSVELNATDSDTIGRLRLSSLAAGALPVWDDFVVLHANVYNSLFGAVALSTYAGGAVPVTGTVVLDAVQPNYAPSKAGDAMTLTVGERGSINNEVDTALADIGLTVLRSAKLDNLDATISSRLATAGYTVPPTASQVRQELDTNSIKLDVAVGTRLASASYTAPTIPPTVIQIRQELDTNSAKLANLDATISSRLLGSTYTAPPSVGAIATQVDATMAARFVGLSTFDGGPVASVTAPVTVGTNNDKDGYKLAPDGIDDIDSTLNAVPTNFRQRMLWVFYRAFRPNRSKTTGVLTVKNAAGTVITSQNTTDTETEQTTGDYI